MKMKSAAIRTALVVVAVIMVLVLGLSTVMAAKPQDSGSGKDVIAMSNGFPSGVHFNLNIHGKKADYNCDPSPGGNSVFILEYGISTIQYVSNKKSSVTELKAVDRCAEAFDNDPAKVQLPKEEQGYYVFARVRAKPQNGTGNDEPSSILLVPDPVLEVCNDTDPENPDFPDFTECPNDELLALGLVTNQGVYDLTEQGFERFDDTSDSKGKGKAKALDITGLFLWTGYVCDVSLDTNGDGVINELDVPLEYDLAANGGNDSGVIDPAELQNWLADQELAGNCTFYENEWVFNVADLVVQDQEVTNDGVKLLKIRFYPVSTTEFIR